MKPNENPKMKNAETRDRDNPKKRCRFVANIELSGNTCGEMAGGEANSDEPSCSTIAMMGNDMVKKAANNGARPVMSMSMKTPSAIAADMSKPALFAPSLEYKRAHFNSKREQVVPVRKEPTHMRGGFARKAPAMTVKFPRTAQPVVRIP